MITPLSLLQENFHWGNILIQAPWMPKTIDFVKESILALLASKVEILQIPE